MNRADKIIASLNKDIGILQASVIRLQRENDAKDKRISSLEYENARLRETIMAAVKKIRGQR